MMEKMQLKMILEGAIFAAGETVTIERMTKLFAEEEQVTVNQIKEALAELEEDCKDRAYHLKVVSSGYRFQVNADLSPWMLKLWEGKPPKYSKAVLETLALVAYRQPATRAEVEEIRGVTSSSHIFKTLLERDWIKVVGHKDVPGRPSLYATSRQFLDYFNLQSLEDLPTLAEVMDLEKIAKQFGQQLELISDDGQITAETLSVAENETNEEVQALETMALETQQDELTEHHIEENEEVNSKEETPEKSLASLKQMFSQQLEEECEVESEEQ